MARKSYTGAFIRYLEGRKNRIVWWWRDRNFKPSPNDIRAAELMKKIKHGKTTMTDLGQEKKPYDLVVESLSGPKLKPGSGDLLGNMLPAYGLQPPETRKRGLKWILDRLKT